MFGFFKKKHHFRLLLNIRSSEAYHPANKPEGLRDSGSKYFNEYYVRPLKLDYPPIMGISIQSPCPWWGYHLIERISYDEQNHHTDCWLEDLVVEYDTLMEILTDMQACLVNEGWRKLQADEVDRNSLAESTRW